MLNTEIQMNRISELLRLWVGRAGHSQAGGKKGGGEGIYNVLLLPPYQDEEPPWKSLTKLILWLQNSLGFTSKRKCILSLY